MFKLYNDLIIYSMALKSPDGELSLEVGYVHGVGLHLHFVPLEACKHLF